MQSPQILSPPSSLISISPPPPLYNPPNPQSLFALLRDLFEFFIHVLLAPFSARLIPCHPSHPYGFDLYPAPPPETGNALVPVRRERRRQSKSPSASPSSMTLTEETADGEVRVRTSTERSAFRVRKAKIRPGKGKIGVTLKHEAWAKEAFKM
jgi:hypothetical protein